MIGKTLALFALVAAVNCGAPISYLAADHHVGAQSEQTVRGFGGLSSVSQYSKAVDGTFSSVRKTDTRVTNDAVHAIAVPTYAHQTYAAAPVAAVAHHGYAHQAYAAAPVAHSYGHQTYAAAPLAVAHHGYAHQAYAAAPVAAVAHHGYAAAPLAVANHGYAAGLGHTYASQVNHHYSHVSPAVATYSFDGVGLGHFGY